VEPHAAGAVAGAVADAGAADDGISVEAGTKQC
jgi:hypothetical protein